MTVRPFNETRITRRASWFAAAALVWGALAFRAVPAGAADVYCVVDELLPITSEPGAEYVIEPHDVFGESVEGIVVYGNHITTRPLDDDKFAGAWVELLSPEDGDRIGFVPTVGLEARPEMEHFAAREYIVSGDRPELLLQPGRTDEKYRLSGRGFFVMKGEVVTAFGRNVTDDGEWLLLGFSTSTEEEGDSGIGMRYAWAPSGELLPLSEYEPSVSELDASWLPPGIRRAAYSIREGWTNAEPYAEVEGPLRRGVLKNGFWIDPEPIIPEYVMVDDISDLYSDTGEYEADFITADIFMHSFHLIFDQMLKKFEMSRLAPTLGECLSGAASALDEAKPALEDAGVAEYYETARDMFSVASEIGRAHV
jgi:hypothetical protein